MYERGPRVFFHPSAKPRNDGMACGACISGSSSHSGHDGQKWVIWRQNRRRDGNGIFGPVCCDSAKGVAMRNTTSHHNPIPLYTIYSHSLARSHHLQLFRSPLVRALFYFCENMKTGLSAYLLSMLSILSYAFFIFFFLFFLYFFFARRSSCLSYRTTSLTVRSLPNFLTLRTLI